MDGRDIARTPALTLAICTWNRAPLLAMTLGGLAEHGPLDDCDLLVVDNGATDLTAAVLAEWRDRLPLRVVPEARLGLSHARNRAVAEARGTHIIFLDDDVIVQPGWLDAYRTAFAEHPDSAIFGGPIAARFLGVPPAWLPELLPQLKAAFAIRDLGTAPFSLDAERLPFGANMAFRADVLRRQPFNTALGRSGRGMKAGEEAALMSRLLAAGETGWWVPGAAVDHVMPPSRQTAGYLRRFYRGLGETYGLDDRAQGGRFQLFGVPSWLWRRLLTGYPSYLVARCGGRPSHWVPRLVRLARDEGAFMAFRTLQPSGGK
jgi:glycosyltransferase involved in cell wall biosynthesis